MRIDFPIAAVQKIPSASPFDPASIAGLYVWQAAFNPFGDGTLPADGTKISDWDDLSGNGRDMINASVPQQPIIKLNIQNGLPVIRFDNTDSQYLGATVSAISPAGFTMFMAHRVRTLGGTPETVMSFGNGATDGMAFIPDSTANLVLYGGVAIDDLSLFPSDTNFNVVCLRYNGVGPISKGWINNQDGALSVTGYTANLPVSTIWYGSSNSAAGFANVDLGEGIIYNRALTDEEVSTVNLGLMNRWGL